MYTIYMAFCLEMKWAQCQWSVIEAIKYTNMYTNSPQFDLADTFEMASQQQQKRKSTTKKAKNLI